MPRGGRLWTYVLALIGVSILAVALMILSARGTDEDQSAPAAAGRPHPPEVPAATQGLTKPKTGTPKRQHRTPGRQKKKKKSTSKGRSERHGPVTPPSPQSGVHNGEGKRPSGEATAKRKARQSPPTPPRGEQAPTGDDAIDPNLPGTFAPRPPPPPPVQPAMADGEDNASSPTTTVTGEAQPEDNNLP